mmetsp:Transcript_51155/g.147634  ORF Transcript_51155/g.147634 Transcript_51155/m.147634 type:complete len:448 (+) Transcript_51155:674-2017(+)
MQDCGQEQRVPGALRGPADGAVDQLVAAVGLAADLHAGGLDLGADALCVPVARAHGALGGGGPGVRQGVRQRDGHGERARHEDLVDAPEAPVDVGLTVGHDHHPPAVHRVEPQHAPDEHRTSGADDRAEDAELVRVQLRSIFGTLVGCPLALYGAQSEPLMAFRRLAPNADDVPIFVEGGDAARANDRPNEHGERKQGAQGREDPQVLAPPPQQPVALALAADVLQDLVEGAFRRRRAELLWDARPGPVLTLVQREGANEHDIVGGDGQLQRPHELLDVLAPSVRHHDVDLQRRILVEEQGEAEASARRAWLDIFLHHLVEVLARVPARLALALGKKFLALRKRDAPVRGPNGDVPLRCSSLHTLLPEVWLTTRPDHLGSRSSRLCVHARGNFGALFSGQQPRLPQLQCRRVCGSARDKQEEQQAHGRPNRQKGEVGFATHRLRHQL